jgi:hypothetical protein
MNRLHSPGQMSTSLDASINILTHLCIVICTTDLGELCRNKFVSESELTSR